MEGWWRSILKSGCGERVKSMLCRYDVSFCGRGTIPAAYVVYCLGQRNGRNRELQTLKLANIFVFCID